MGLGALAPLNYRHSILIIDDEELIIKALKRVLASKEYEIHSAGNGEEGLHKLRSAEKPFSLIISDQRMPGMTGVQFFTQAKDICPMAIRILLTGYADTDAIIGAINSGGIHLFLTKPWHDEELLFNIQQCLSKAELMMENQRLDELIKKQNNELLELNKHLDEKVQKKTQHLVAQAQKLKTSYKKTKHILEGTVRAMSKVVESRDPYTAGHEEQVSRIACMIAGKMSFSARRIEGIRIAASMHDIGKIAVPSEILTKPGKLNELEFEIIKTHCQVAYDILKTIDFPYPVAEIILQHHERLNGTGYPQGLSGDQILPEARIIAVADVIEAMASHRPYRPALGVDAAIEEIVKYGGIYYDATAVDVCRKIYSDEGISEFYLGVDKHATK